MRNEQTSKIVSRPAYPSIHPISHHFRLPLHDLFKETLIVLVEARKVDLQELSGAMDADEVRFEEAEVVKRDQPHEVVDRVADVNNDAAFAQFDDHELDVLTFAETAVKFF